MNIKILLLFLARVHCACYMCC